MPTHHVAALTSYVETPPSNLATMKKPFPARVPSILLSPTAAKGRRLPSYSHQGTPKHVPDSSTNRATARRSESATTRQEHTLPDALSAEVSETTSRVFCDSPSAAASRECVPRLRLGSSASSNASTSRTGRMDGDSHAALLALESLPFTTFTSHLRQRLAMSDAGTDIDGSSNNIHSLSSNEAPARVETKTAAANTAPSLPRMNSARGTFSSDMLSPPLTTRLSDAPPGVLGLPFGNTPSAWNSSVSESDSSITKALRSAEVAACDNDLDAVSRELTALLRGSCAAMQLLAQKQRPLLPEQLRWVATMQQLCADTPVDTESQQDAAQGSGTISPLTHALSASERVLLRGTLTNECRAPSPQRRTMIRPQRNVTWE